MIPTITLAYSVGGELIRDTIRHCLSLRLELWGSLIGHNGTIDLVSKLGVTKVWISESRHYSCRRDLVVCLFACLLHIVSCVVNVVINWPGDLHKRVLSTIPYRWILAGLTNSQFHVQTSRALA